MSDEREKVKSRKASAERNAEVAQRLGMDPVEIAVFTNPDGEYAVIKDGTRVLLQDEGRVAWYGEKAPNPTYPLVVPSVELDEAEFVEVEAADGPTPPDGVPVEPLNPDGGPAKPAPPRATKK